MKDADLLNVPWLKPKLGYKVAAHTCQAVASVSIAPTPLKERGISGHGKSLTLSAPVSPIVGFRQGYV